MKSTKVFLSIILLFCLIAYCKKESENNQVRSKPNTVAGEITYLGALSIPRSGTAGAAAGSKIIFAGGYGNEPTTKIYATVDVYDTITKKWSTANLSEERWQIGVVQLKDRILFAGGVRQFDSQNGWHDFTSRVDIYHTTTNQWSTMELPEPMAFPPDDAQPVSAKNLVFFYKNGGTDIHVYDIDSDSWSTSPISEPRWYLASASDPNHVFFCGGIHSQGQISKRVDIYNSVLKSWTIDSLREGRHLLKGATARDKTLFVGGRADPYSPVASEIADIYDNTMSGWTPVYHLSDGILPGYGFTLSDNAIFIDKSRVEIYNGATGEWTTSKLFSDVFPIVVSPWSATIITSNNKVFIAGEIAIVKSQGYYPEYTFQRGVYTTHF